MRDFSEISGFKALHLRLTFLIAVSTLALFHSSPVSAQPDCGGGARERLIQLLGLRSESSGSRYVPSGARGGRLSRVGNAFDHRAAAQDLRMSPEMIYFDQRIPELPSGEFHASNEFDWFLTPQDFEKTDTLIGFGTNSAWDLAVRKNADQLVIGDWHIGTLMTQEYLMRPLLLEAKSPAEFVSMLAGVPLPKELKDADLAKVFRHIDAYFSKVKEVPPPYDPERARFLNSILERMEKSRKITDTQLKGVASYFNALMNPPLSPGDPRFGPVFGSYTQRFFQENLTGSGPLYSMFKWRYDPEKLIESGAKEEDVKKPLFSFLSSPEALARLKRLFDGRIHYLHASYDDAEAYRSIRSQLHPDANARYTLSATNIIDCQEQLACNQRQRLQTLLGTAGRVLASEESPLVVFRSTNTQPPHEFLRYEIPSVTRMDAEIARVEGARPRQSIPDNGFDPRFLEFMRLMQQLRQGI